MSRIRTIKPDFWEDEGNAGLSRDARLLFIGTWNFADDEGLLRWTPAYLKAAVFMYDDDLSVARVEKLMAETLEGGHVFAYHGGRAHHRLGFIVNFRKHQRINRPQPSRLPFPSLQNCAVKMMYARRDNYRCHLCGGPVAEAFDPKDPDTQLNASPDHLIPRSLGGTDAPSNIATAHLKCNQGRGAGLLGDPASFSESFSESVVNDSLLEGNGREGIRKGRDKSANADVVKVFEAWRATMPKPGAVQLTEERRKAIRGALEDYPVDDLVRAVSNWPKSAFHRGENKQQTVYNKLTLILRDADRIEFFRDLEDAQVPAFS